jgi:hypothetical protein
VQASCISPAVTGRRAAPKGYRKQAARVLSCRTRSWLGALEEALVEIYFVGLSARRVEGMTDPSVGARCARGCEPAHENIYRQSRRGGID